MSKTLLQLKAPSQKFSATATSILFWHSNNITQGRYCNIAHSCGMYNRKKRRHTCMYTHTQSHTRVHTHVRTHRIMLRTYVYVPVDHINKKYWCDLPGIGLGRNLGRIAVREKNVSLFPSKLDLIAIIRVTIATNPIKSHCLLLAYY